MTFGSTRRVASRFTTALSQQYWGQGSVYSVTTLWLRLAEVGSNGLKRLEVPVVMLIGRQDQTTSASLAASWMTKLRAPSKVTVWFEHSAHLAMIEEPGRFFAALLEHVRPLTQRAGDAAR